MTAIQIPPPGFEFGDARRRFVEHYGAAIMLARYQQIALVCLALVAVGLLVLNVRTHQALNTLKPLVIRIDEVGRATAITYDRFLYQPQAPELKYFLTQFVIQHYARVRATVRENFAASLYFLDGRLADATMAANQKSRAIETFLTNGSDEIEVAVQNVALEDLREPPFKATVDFEKIYVSPGDHLERKRERFVGHFVFVVKDRVPNAFIPINPLGLTITYFREDQAFQ
jgi:type IV secretory pathway TrbF-like protein